MANMTSTARVEHYYLPAVNAWGDPNHNQVPAATFDGNMLTVVQSEAEDCNPSGVYTSENVEQEPVDLEPALGRIFHESANPIINHDGRVVIYMGDDGRNEFLYRFVSTEKYNPQNHNPDILDTGTLSVAKFFEDGHLEWLPIKFGDQLRFGAAINNDIR